MAISYVQLLDIVEGVKDESALSLKMLSEYLNSYCDGHDEEFEKLLQDDKGMEGWLYMNTYALLEAQDKTRDSFVEIIKNYLKIIDNYDKIDISENA